MKIKTLLLIFSTSIVILNSCVKNQNHKSTQSNICHTGSWAGWAYVDGVGDFPFRVRHNRNNAASLDISFAKLFNHPIKDFVYENNKLSFVWESEKGDRRLFDGEQKNGTINGHIDWSGSNGTFNLNCSTRQISPVDTQVAGLDLGHYLFNANKSNEQVIKIGRADYGEIYLRSLRNGKQRVVFPIGNSQYFLGKSLYDPSSMSVKFNVENGSDIEIIKNGLGLSGKGQKFDLIKKESIIDTADGKIRVISTQRSIGPLNIGIVIVPGSGWQIAEDENFRSDSLAALGFTVISYDKRGYGKSPGKQERKFGDSARDTKWVTLWAQNANNSIHTWGALGISRGGWMVPQIPGLNSLYNFLILSVSPATTPYVQEFSSRKAQLIKQGVSQETYSFAEKYYKALVDFAKSDKVHDKHNYEMLHAQAIEKLPENLLGESIQAEAEWTWWRLNGDYNPKQDLKNIKIATLVLLGENDLMVPLIPNKTMMQQYGKNVKVIENVGHDLSIPFNKALWKLDTLGSEGIEEVRNWALLNSKR